MQSAIRAAPPAGAAGADGASRAGEQPRVATPLPRLLELAEVDPRLAAEQALGMEDRKARSQALREVVQVWLASAPDAASAWLLARAERLAPETLLALTSVVAGVDVAPALQLAQLLPAGLRSSAMTAVFGEWTAHAPWAAAHAAEQLTETSDRVAAVGEVARLWAHTEPVEALAWSHSLSEPLLQRVGVDSLLATWADREPAAAAVAISALPADPARARWLDRVLAPWAAQQPEAAYVFVSQLGDAVERESAATSVLMQVLPAQPQRALEWARELSSGADSALLEKLMTAWVAQDASAAVAWTRGLPAAESDRAHLLALALARWQDQDAPAYRQWQLAHRGKP